MKVIETKLQDVKLIETSLHGDKRGFFTESYSVKDFKEVGIDFDFVQDNHSLSTEAGVIRGLHFQKGESAQTKLIRVATGVVLDVIVDIRKGSPTYGQWEGYILSEFNHRQLLVPRGYAHAFVTLTPNVNFLYKCDHYYNPEADSGIALDDPDLSIDWPVDISKAVLSEKDKHHPTFKEFESENPFVYGKI
ncbi:MAG: dTDP-4-dehydrorhamnose 3,5-epimerase [Staphylococcus equorum]|uniref:dTDP-4-dehydrorhamnose 3,5-epimerase n=1 Tax=Tetragenococcus halophilus TaxID=51669 RepID=UPI00264AB389|nr:dTDP-4-dehydrorhamnose 3,5-epimerase [Staphylococcus equorum]MDN6267624.1 dTDP-4-dehydrorhamnose 3,5-epimerase [Tetragenococcus koreensis]MDN6571721.1 dTDP-4-dehydrorhamnose 3,5-epimerase [Staphylococcus equorum]